MISCVNTAIHGQETEADHCMDRTRNEFLTGPNGIGYHHQDEMIWQSEASTILMAIFKKQDCNYLFGEAKENLFLYCCIKTISSQDLSSNHTTILRFRTC